MLIEIPALASFTPAPLTPPAQTSPTAMASLVTAATRELASSPAGSGDATWRDKKAGASAIRRWTAIEDQVLSMAVSAYPVCIIFVRSSQCCKDRFILFSLGLLITAALQASAQKNWKKIAEYLVDRTDVQCQHRWQKVLNPDLVKGPWTKEVGQFCMHA